MCDLCNGPELKVEKATGTHWVSYCRQCRDSQGRPVLMAASSDHIMMRDEETRAIYAAMEKDLEEVAMRIYGPGNYQLDHQQRQVLIHHTDRLKTTCTFTPGQPPTKRAPSV